MRLAELDYPLPEALIAQAPAPERAAARLLVLDRGGAPLRHAHVGDLPGVLRAGDVLVVNDTRVIPARVSGRRPSGGRLELLFVAPLGEEGEWEVLVRGTARPGERVHLAGGRGEWVAPLGDGRWRLRLALDEPALAWLERVGEVPLPPYVRRAPTPADRERYRTVYARVPGAVAAPTAGLHLSAELLAAIAAAGVRVATLTLHGGPGPEPSDIPPATVETIGAARARGGRVVAVGTTTVRALESAWADGAVRAGPGAAALFIRPGHCFRVVDALLTNFHLPRSTLLALVAAFAGWDRIRAAYAEAVRLGYRFYSYGDAMLIT